MSRPKNTTAPPPAQPSQPELSNLRHLFRAAYGAHGIARILLEDSAEIDGLLAGRDREALLNALELLTGMLYAHHEGPYEDALPHAGNEGGAQ